MNDQANDVPTLNLTDIQQAVAAIDTACDSGAYKGWEEIGKVFAVRERMVKFLNAAHAAQKEQAEQAEQAEAGNTVLASNDFVPAQGG